MPERSSTYRARLEKGGERDKKYPVAEAIKILQTMGEVKAVKSYKGARKRKGFDQTVELVMHLGIDPKQADQMIRGSVSLPKGIGASKKVIAFCPDDMAADAKAAGAIEAGADELIKKVSDGWLDFDVAVAHPQVMGKVGKLGRVLGPQGKMPSPKSGTVTPEIAQAVREYAAGKLEFRNDAGGNVHAVVGKLSFTPEDLQANVEAFIDHIRRIKPSGAKGQYVRKVSLSATMSPSVLIDAG
jgi:large subunit ribosomal protein L1